MNIDDIACIDKVKDDELNIQVATLCGYKNIYSIFSIAYQKDLLKGTIDNHVLTIPDYVYDLNAMAELEKNIFTDAVIAERYEKNLMHIVQWSQSLRTEFSWAIKASAKQRAEAYVLTMKKEKYERDKGKE